MENTVDKVHFLQHEYAKKLAQIPAGTTPKWGKMNVQQMIEHMSDYMRIANGRTPMEIVTDAEMIPRMQAFLASDKQFKENTPNILMSDTPPPVRNESHEAAIAELQGEVDHFINTYAATPDKTMANPFFGHLNFEQQLQLLYKHSTHHLRQFGVE